MAGVFPKSAARRTIVVVVLLGALAAAYFAYAAVAAAGKPDFTMTASPSSQTVVKPLSGTAPATYSFSVTRVNGMTDPVTLSLSSLPAGVTVGSALSPNPVPSNGNSASLTLNVGTAAVPGTYSFTVTGVGKTPAQTHSVTTTLVVNAAPAPDFNLSASPATQTINQGDSATIGVALTRVNGFTGNVTLTYSGTPAPAIVSWTPPGGVVNNPGTSASLGIDTDPSVTTGTFTITITAASGALVRSAQVTLIVQKGIPQHFDISGNARGTLYPGDPVGSPIDLTFRNTTNQTIKITVLTVSVEQATSKPGCGGTANYQVTQLLATAYPLLVLGPGQTKSFGDLGVPDASRPHVRMLNGGNQDACKNATVYLDYSGTATK